MEAHFPPSKHARHTFRLWGPAGGDWLVLIYFYQHPMYHIMHFINCQLSNMNDCIFMINPNHIRILYSESFWFNMLYITQDKSMFFRQFPIQKRWKIKKINLEVRIYWKLMNGPFQKLFMHDSRKCYSNINIKQAGTDLCQAQFKLG